MSLSLVYFFCVVQLPGAHRDLHVRTPSFPTRRSSDLHIPPAELAANNKRRVIAPESDYVDDDSAREAGKIAAAGRMVSIGAHGQQSGLGAHWEIWRSEEHTSELQSLMRSSYAVFCLKKKHNIQTDSK